MTLIFFSSIGTHNILSETGEGVLYKDSVKYRIYRPCFKNKRRFRS